MILVGEKKHYQTFIPESNIKDIGLKWKSHSIRI